MDSSNCNVSKVKLQNHNDYTIVRNSLENKKSCESAINHLFQNLPRQDEDVRSEMSFLSPCQDYKLNQFHPSSKFNVELQQHFQLSDVFTQQFYNRSEVSAESKTDIYGNAGFLESAVPPRLSYTRPNFSQQRNSGTQTERSPFEEKFLFRENILHGCDLITELGNKLPSVAELHKYSEFLREKTMQSRGQNTCSKMAVDVTESMVVSEYIKTFLRISDAWLDARNCFGLDRYCSTLCKLNTPELPCNYAEWMHTSRLLINSIVIGLEKVNKFYRKDNLIRSNSTDKLNSAIASRSYPGGSWGYAPNAQCQCACSVKPEEPSRLTTQAHSDPTLWYPVQNNNILMENSINEKLKPSCYEVPRNNLSAIAKRLNISKTKMKFESVVNEKGYVIDVPTSQNDEEGSREPSVDGNDDDNVELTKGFLVKRSEGHVDGYKQFQNKLLNNSDDENDNTLTRGSMQSVKIEKNPRSSQNRKSRNLAQTQQASRMLEIVRTLRKHEILSTSYSKDSETQCISLENISNKVKNSSYDTLDQFIHDCRKLFLTASNSQKNKHEKEKIQKIRGDYEKNLEKYFDNAHIWNYISGDPKEVKMYPELSINKAKVTKNSQN